MPLVRRRRGTTELAKRQTPEGKPKVGIIKRINERIDGTVQPAQPRQRRHGVFAEQLVWQKRYQQIVNEERQPARDETADHGAQRFRCFRFALRRRDADRHAFRIGDIVGDIAGNGGHVVRGAQWYRQRGADKTAGRAVLSLQTALQLMQSGMRVAVGRHRRRRIHVATGASDCGW